MWLTEPMPYLLQRGIEPTVVVECAGNCTNTFVVADGFAWPAKIPEREQPVMVFFCSAGCCLRVIPKTCCGSA